MSEYRDRNFIINGYNVVIEQESAHNFGAYSPQLPGCVAAGSTLDEVVLNMSEVIPLYIEGLIEDGLPVPPPTKHSIQSEALTPQAR
jgi:predicted RNase H-like HicB family nuclease